MTAADIHKLMLLVPEAVPDGYRYGINALTGDGNWWNGQLCPTVHEVERMCIAELVVRLTELWSVDICRGNSNAFIVFLDSSQNGCFHSEGDTLLEALVAAYAAVKEK